MEGARRVYDAVERNDLGELGRLLDEDPGLIEAKLYGMTPLCRASVNGSVDAARLLLDRGADISTEYEEGQTALMLACYNGHVEVVMLLLDRGADPSVHAFGGRTALTEASDAPEFHFSDHVAVIRLLIKDGRVPVNARDQRGSTALWYACRCEHTERARVLLMDGLADHTIADEQGLTPTLMAQRRRFGDCSRLLKRYEGELHKAFLLSKARAVLDSTHSITKAPDKAHAQTQAEAQRAREEAAPAWLRGRVVGGEALPTVEVVGQTGLVTDDEGKREEELCAVCDWLVGVVSEDLHLELMEGLRYRRWVPVDEERGGGGKGSDSRKRTSRECWDENGM